MSRHLQLASLCAILLMQSVSLSMAQGTGSAAPKAESSAQTPRTSDGKPSFDGYWGRLAGESAQQAGGDSDIQFQNGDGHLTGTVEGFQRWLSHFEKDAQVSIRAQRNRPIYKPEFWQKIRTEDWDHSRKKDPSSHCLPAVGRLGPPQRIIQMKNEMILFYEGLNRYRFIPTDGRAHDPIRVSIGSWFGESIGHWEGSWTWPARPRGCVHRPLRSPARG